MKYLKTFEDIKEGYKVGDYVLMNVSSTLKYVEDFVNFVNSTPGQIYKISPVYSHHNGDWLHDDILVLYEDDDIPNYIKFHMIRSNNIKGPVFKTFVSTEIKYFADTKDELEAKIKSDKYNL